MDVLSGTEQERDEDINLPVAEEDILNSLFYVCDPQNTGLVKVSELIIYLRKVIGSIDEGTGEYAGNLNTLSLLLDPGGGDVLINVETFHNAISHWIRDIRRSSFETSPQTGCNGEMDHGGSFLDFEQVGKVDVSSESVEGVSGDSPVRAEWERDELVNTLKENVITIKKLTEEKRELQSQMELLEEANISITHECENMNKSIRSSTALNEKSKEIQKENEDLRQADSEAQQKILALHLHIQQLEKEKVSLEMTGHELQHRFCNEQAKYEALEMEYKSILQAYSDQKRQMQDYGRYTDFVEEPNYYMNMVEELTLEMEDLRADNKNKYLIITKQEEEISRLKFSKDYVNGQTLNGLNSPPDNTPAHNTSTSFVDTTNLQQELKEHMIEDGYMVSPFIVGPDLNTSQESDFMNHSYDRSHDQSWMSGDSMEGVSICTTASMEKYSTVAMQAISDFRNKKDRFLKNLAELSVYSKGKDVKERRELLCRQLEEEMESFSEKLSSLTQSKKSADKRIGKLRLALKKLKEENKLLIEERDRAFKKLGNLSLCSDELDQKVDEMSKKLEKEHQRIQQLDQKLVDMEKELSSTREQLAFAKEETKTVNLTLEKELNEKIKLESELLDMRRILDDNVKDQKDSLSQIFELENELSAMTTQLTVERKRVTSLEESISVSVQRHSDDLLEIYQLVPSFNSEPLTKNKLSPRDFSPAVTAFTVKSKLKDYITHSESLFKQIIRDSPDGKPTTIDEEDEEHSNNQQQNIFQQHLSDSHSPITGSEDHMRNRTSSPVCYSPNLIEPFTMLPQSHSSPSENIITSSADTFALELSQKVLKTCSRTSQTDWSDLNSPRKTDSETQTVCLQTGFNNFEISLLGDETASYLTAAQSTFTSESGVDSGDVSASTTSETQDIENSPLSELHRVNFEQKLSGSQNKLEDPVGLKFIDDPSINATSSPIVKEEFISSLEAVELNEPTVECLSQQQIMGVQEPSISIISDLSDVEATPQVVKQSGVSFTAAVLTTEECVPHESDYNGNVTFEDNSQTPKKRGCLSRSTRFETGEETRRQKETEIGDDDSLVFKTEIKEETTTKTMDHMLTPRKALLEFQDSEEFNDQDADLYTLHHSSSFSKLQSPVVDGISMHVSPTLNDKEIEKQFKTLVLAYRTDKMTLNQRLEFQERARDLAEERMEKEINQLNDKLQELEDCCQAKDDQELIAGLRYKVDMLRKSSKRLSTQAQLNGCFLQEGRMMSGVEVLIHHAENLTRQLTKLREDLDLTSDTRDGDSEDELIPLNMHKDSCHVPSVIEPTNDETSMNDQERQCQDGSTEEQNDQQDGSKDSDTSPGFLHFASVFSRTSVLARVALSSFRKRRTEREINQSQEAVPESEHMESVSSADDTVFEEDSNRHVDASREENPDNCEDSVDDTEELEPQPSQSWLTRGRKFTTWFLYMIIRIILSLLCIVSMLYLLGRYSGFDAYVLWPKIRKYTKPYETYLRVGKAHT